MELNSLNTQHATLPTATTHHPYHVYCSDCPGYPPKYKHWTMDAM